MYFLNSRFINPSVYNVCREGDLKMDKICEYCEGKGYDYEKCWCENGKTQFGTCNTCNGTGKDKCSCSVCKGTGSSKEEVIIAQVRAENKRANNYIKENCCNKCGDNKQDCECD